MDDECLYKETVGEISSRLRANQLPNPVTTVFDSTLPGFVIHMDQPKTFGESTIPFEVIHQRPKEFPIGQYIILPQMRKVNAANECNFGHSVPPKK